MRRPFCIAVKVGEDGELKVLRASSLRATPRNGDHFTDPYEVAEELRQIAADIYQNSGSPYWDAPPMSDSDST